jgi:CheY-like chemotaxis protein
LYPARLLWVDDDDLFLQIASEALKNSYDIKTCISPEECLQFYQNYEPVLTSSSLFQGCREHEEYDLSDHLPVDVNLDVITNLSQNKQRMQDISVMIVDYNMPGMTGIELCRELRKLPIKKILLTGEANHQQAIEAFNDGIIDCFIRKDEQMLATDLLMHIKKLNFQYFAETTKHLLAHLETDYKLPQSDPVFINFFNKWCLDNKICEYYVIDKNGTFLTINEGGNIQYFLAQTNRSLNVFTEIYAEDNEDSTFIQSLIQRNKIPFFGFKKEPWNYEFHEWNSYVYSPQVLHGREVYYWAVIENKSFVEKQTL